MSKKREHEVSLPDDSAAAPTAAVIEIPLGQVEPGAYLSRHVEARLSTEQQRVALRRLLLGLRGAGEKLADGRPVQSLGQVILWLLEQVPA